MCIKNTAIIGVQWGDEGKGKICNVLARDFSCVARYAGGGNAGHTVIYLGKKFKLHHIPSGIFFSEKINLLGSGMVIDILTLEEEIESLRKQGISCKNLKISSNAHVVMPYHKFVDGWEERERGGGGLGTTRRGIGPAYTDKVSRRGIRIEDLLYPELLTKKVKNQMKRWSFALEGFGTSAEKICQEYTSLGQRISQYITEGTHLLNQMLKDRKKVLFEGAQGVLLDIDWGTYPYVTSSGTTAGNIPQALGISPKYIERVIGVAKAYTTRIGTGPFPTEEFGSIGKYLLEKGQEYGTTTGRPRRCGWLDLVLLKYAVEVSGIDEIALTKLDVLSGLETLKICTSYTIGKGEEYTFPTNPISQQKAIPNYKEVKGWKEDIQDINSFHKLPKPAQEYIKIIEEYLNIPVTIISVGPSPEQTILKET